MDLRRVQPAIFGITLLCFLLPFGAISCTGEGEVAANAGDTGESERSTLAFKGYELVLGMDYPEDWDPSEEFVLEPTQWRWPPEPFAIIAMLSAIAGLVLTLIGLPARQARLGVVASAVGLLSIILLGLSPTLRAVGLARVEWKIGYWVTGLGFILALGISLALRGNSVVGAGAVTPTPPPPPDG